MTKPFAFSLCADDYAMTPGVTRGILEGLEAGALKATSVMTTSPTWPESAPALLPFIDRADIGLHLNLTLGAPLGPMPILAPDGRLPDIGTMMRLARSARLPLDEIAAEIDRQMTTFGAIMGRAPDHVDGHQHVHVLGSIRTLLLDALDTRGWRPWLRDSADRPIRILTRRTTLKKALGLSVIAGGWARAATQRGYAVNEGFSGFSDFNPARDYGSQFARYLVAPGPRHLVMCHPGYVDEALRRLDPVVETRERELAFLTSPAFRTLIARTGAVPERLSSRLEAART
jgi:predicted glycoside hydrolase/deacetylase ChbG (UPF0249 family)